MIIVVLYALKCHLLNRTIYAANSCATLRHVSPSRATLLTFSSLPPAEELGKDLQAQQTLPCVIWTP